MSPHVPYQIPDWRWQRACRIVSECRYATKRHDPLIRRAVHCLRALNRAKTQRGVKSITKKYPDIVMAMKVSTENDLRPLEIKARLLAGQTDRAVARAAGLTVPIVAAYAALYFDVRERLAAGMWIRQVVIGLPPTGPASVEALMLLHCWKRGPEVVEPWMDYVAHQGETHDLSTEVGRQRASISLLVAAHQLPDDPNIRRSLFKKFYFIAREFPEIPRPASVSGVISRNGVQLTGQVAWREPNEGVVFGGADADESRTRRPGRQARELAWAE